LVLKDGAWLISMPHDNKIITIVDKELENGQSLQNALSTIEGINVLKFTNPVEALEHLKTNKKNYAVMISDLRMPVINGVQLLKTVKDVNPSIRTILMTGYETNNNLLQEYNKNEIINSFLRKPIKLDKLLSEVNRQIWSIKILENKK
jgi:DNA-binding NtrC family response regulator